MRGYRYVFTLFGCMAMAIIYGFKVCMTLVLSKMINETAVKMQQDAKYVANKTQMEEDGKFIWDGTAKQSILLSYFIGYFFSQIPGGIICDTYGAKWVMDFAIFANVACFLLMPISAESGWGTVVMLRIIMGVGGGVSFPATHHLLTAWAPKPERSLITSLVYCGTSLGVMIANLLTGILCEKISWQSVFYIFGGFGLLVTIGWSVLIGETPQTQLMCMTQEEKDYIVSSTGGDHEHPPTPWKAVFKSVPFWAILITHTCGNVAWYTFIIELPIFVEKVLRKKFNETTVHFSIPFFLLWAFTTLFGAIMDKLVEKEILNVGAARKIATAVAGIIPGICLIVICCMSKENENVILVMLYISITASGAMFAGYLCNHMDIAPPFAASLVGITNTVATIPGILMPILIAVLTHKDEHDFQPWRIVFYTTIGFIVAEVTVFSIFASGEVQSWAQIPA